MINLIEDVSTLTTIPTKTLNQLLDKFIYCIVDAVNESDIQDKDVTEIDLYFGNLIIQHTMVEGKHQLKYKFTPASKLNKQFVELFEKKLNSLDVALEKSLANKITYTYKDML